MSAKIKTKVIKNRERPIQKYRFAIQVLFALICIWIGVEFYLFAEFLESGGKAEFFARPPGAEAFLPISAMMSVYYFLLTGVIHPAHPAGFFIFLGIIGVSFAFGKAFCSWICPIGLLSELIGDFGEKLYQKIFRTKKKPKLPKLLDYPLRSLKYLLLAFFVYSIFFAMTTYSLKMFLDSPYNLVADVKMYYFFADISQFSLIVIAVLFVLSIFIRGFWCRYLCPYGALLGMLAFLSPNKIKREESSCIDCSLCTKACPANIKVEKVKTVWSDECTSCLQCVDACPVKDTLQVKNQFTKSKIPKKAVAVGVLGVYFAIIGLGMVTGNWGNNISKEAYLKHYESLEQMGHPRSMKDIDRLNEKAKGNIQEQQ
jgi:polyferredoxin